MNTEITDINANAGWIFYDRDCRFCRAWVRRYGPLLATRHFGLLALQSPDALHLLGPVAVTELSEIKLRMRNGVVLGGADALLEVARRIWWAMPVTWLSRLPGVMPLLRRLYRFIAARRHCLNGTCALPRRRRTLDWLPFMVLPVVVFISRRFMTDWGFMWLLSFALFLGCKWLTLRRAATDGDAPTHVKLAYLFLWPGMDADAFLKRDDAMPPKLRAWLLAFGKMLLGIGLVVKATELTDAFPIFGAWLGMVGIVLILHFGLFHLLALWWRTTGREVKPLMNAPLLATSLTDFWGNRWNTAFNKLAHDLVFRPLVRRVGINGASWSVFLVSGVIHDAVISVPARGGYGLPTLYFLIQALGVWFERSPLGRKLGLGRNWRGRAFALVVLTLPVACLFHPPFLHNIILPMLHAIGATLNKP